MVGANRPGAILFWSLPVRLGLSQCPPGCRTRSRPGGLWWSPFPPNCPFFNPVAELRLEGNYLYRLPNEVSSLQHLRAIDLSRNQFQDFPEQLTTLPALETINLEENEIVGE